VKIFRCGIAAVMLLSCVGTANAGPLGRLFGGICHGGRQSAAQPCSTAGYGFYGQPVYAWPPATYYPASVTYYAAPTVYQPSTQVPAGYNLAIQSQLATDGRGETAVLPSPQQDTMVPRCPPEMSNSQPPTPPEPNTTTRPAPADAPPPAKAEPPATTPFSQTGPR
jgi:hypothetical protein